MKHQLTIEDVARVRAVVAAAKVVGIDSIVLHQGKVMGARPALDAAILAPCPLSLDPAIPVGIGRVLDLDKRLGLCTGSVAIECSINSKSEIAMLALAASRTRMQFRCTSTLLIKHPKEIDDPRHARISMSKDEVQSLTRAVKAFGAERVCVCIASSGAATVTCTDSAHDAFQLELAQPAIFTDEGDITTHEYAAPLLTAALETAAKSQTSLAIGIGERGTAAISIEGYDVLVFALAPSSD